VEVTEQEYKNCSHCDNQIISTSSFCNLCGKFQDVVNLTHLVERKQHLKDAAIFITFELIICITSNLIEEQNLYITLGFDSLLVISSIFFFTTLGKEGFKLLKWPNFSILKLSILVLFTIACSYLVNKAVDWLNPNVFKVYDLPYYLQYSGFTYSNYLMILSIAIIPAIFEELAYRGYLMEKLLKIMGKEETVYLSSFLFFLMHFSIASIFWLLPFAIILGKLRLKENSIWLGVLLHFFFNFTSCIVDLYGSELTLLISEFQFSFWLA